MDEQITVTNLKKYQPGYKDRQHIWAKIYFSIFLDEEFQKLSEVDRYRYISLIIYEVYKAGKPPYLTPTTCTLLGWNTKKRPKSLSLQMLHTLVNVRNMESESCVTQSRVEESRVEKKREEGETTVVQGIFLHWNSKKRKKWKSHTTLSHEIVVAIKLRLKDYSAADLKQAIDNYATVLLGRAYKWSYAWTLYQFLTRCNPNQKTELQLYRWLPNNFSPDDYLINPVAKAAVHRRAQEVAFKPATTEEKLAVRATMPKKVSLANPKSIDQQMAELLGSKK